MNRRSILATCILLALVLSLIFGATGVSADDGTLSGSGGMTPMGLSDSRVSITPVGLAGGDVVVAVYYPGQPLPFATKTVGVNSEAVFQLPWGDYEYTVTLGCTSARQSFSVGILPKWLFYCLSTLDVDVQTTYGWHLIGGRVDLYVNGSSTPFATAPTGFHWQDSWLPDGGIARFAIVGGVPANSYAFRVTNDCYDSGMIVYPNSIAECSLREYEHVMSVNVNFKVTGCGGAGLAGYTVTVVRDWDGATVGSKVTNSSGNASFVLDAEHNYHYTVSKDGFNSGPIPYYACTNGDTVVYEIADDIAPTVVINAPVEGACYASQPAVDYTVTDNCGAPQVNVVWTDLGNMQWKVTVTATDASGNSNSASVNVVIDDQAPLVAITAPSEGAHVHETVEIQGSATDPNLTGLEVTVDGVAVATALPYSWDTTALEDGPHTIGLSAVDCAGNSASAEVHVIVDNTAPMIPVPTQMQASGLGAGTDPLDVTLLGVAEAESRVAIYIMGPGYPDFTYWAGAIADACGRWQVTAPVLDAGTYTFRISAKDKANNYSGHEDYVLNVPGTAPLEAMGLQQGVNNYTGAADVAIDSWSPDGNLNGHNLVVRESGIKNALLRFDLAPIPAGSTVERAVLALYVAGRSNEQALTLNVHELLTDWDQGQATWVLAMQNLPWAGPGATLVGVDLSGDLAGSTLVSKDSGWITVDVTGMVRKWAADGTSNHGLVIKGTAPSSVEYYFHSSESGDVCHRPILMVTYVAGVEEIVEEEVLLEDVPVVEEVPAASEAPTQSLTVTTRDRPARRPN